MGLGTWCWGMVNVVEKAQSEETGEQEEDRVEDVVTL